MSHFILLTTPRSGSTWLGSLLDDHPDITMYGELFLPHDVPAKYQVLRQNDPQKFFRFRETSRLRRPKVTTAYLDHVFKEAEKSVGFKLMAYPLLTHPEIIFYCKKHKIRLLHLTRNTQDRVLSYAIAELENNFHNLGQDIDKKNKITLSVKRVKKLYKKQTILSKALRLIINNISHLSLSIEYDELLQNKADTLQKIYDFLNVPAHTPNSHLQKNLTRPYPEIIENYDDIEKIFKR